jgi:hypothetical protein
VARPTPVKDKPKCGDVFEDSIAVRRGNRWARRGSWKLTIMAGRRRGRSPVGAMAVDDGRRAPVAGDELRWVLEHEGGTGSEEGRWRSTTMAGGGSSP